MKRTLKLDEEMIPRGRGGVRVQREAWVGEGPLVGLLGLALILGRGLEAWVYMWVLAVGIFAGCKWLTWWEGRRELGDVAGWRTGAYFLLWPGMDALGFLDAGRTVGKAGAGDWGWALGKTVFGAGVLWGLVRVVPGGHPLVQGWVGMVGLIFLLHFGLFHLLALFWQRMGVAVRPLMHRPIGATSLGEFWGECWNRGFNDIARNFVFKPLWPRVGVVGATMAAFLVSGLVHEVAITVPARGGYGLPTAYFLIQGVGILVERAGVGRWLGLRRGVRGWLFTMAVTVGPAGILFPPVFVERVMAPFLKFLGAL